MTWRGWWGGAGAGERWEEHARGRLARVLGARRARERRGQRSAAGAAGAAPAAAGPPPAALARRRHPRRMRRCPPSQPRPPRTAPAPAHRRRAPCHPAPTRAHLVAQDLLLALLVPKGAPPEEHLVEDDAQRPDVHLLSGREGGRAQGAVHESEWAGCSQLVGGGARGPDVRPRMCACVRACMGLLSCMGLLRFPSFVCSVAAVIAAAAAAAALQQQRRRRQQRRRQQRQQQQHASAATLAPGLPPPLPRALLLIKGAAPPWRTMKHSGGRYQYVPAPCGSRGIGGGSGEQIRRQGLWCRAAGGR